MTDKYEPIETVVDVDNVQYALAETGNEANRRFTVRVTDLDSGEIVNISWGIESVMRARFDALVGKVSIVSRESHGANALSRIFD